MASIHPSIPEPTGVIHDCGGSISNATHDGCGYSYCERCGAFNYDDSGVTVFPTGTDRELNRNSWDGAEDRSPDSESSYTSHGVTVDADWTDASSPVLWIDKDSQRHATVFQVADARHNRREACAIVAGWLQSQGG